MWKILGLIGLFLAITAGRRILMMLVMRGVAMVVGKSIGSHAVNQQPDQIHLSPCGAAGWTDARAALALSAPLVQAGFEDAGTYRVAPMPGVVVQLLAHRKNSIYANVYEHPRAGRWIELVSRYQDGTAAWFSTNPPTGLDARPGHMRKNYPGLTPQTLLERMLAERPTGWMNPVSTDDAVKAFEAGYADYIAWKKKSGVSAKEVVQVAQRSKAA
jgi:hypothetical protein